MWVLDKLHLYAWGANVLWRHGRPRLVVHFSAGVGDEVLCTCVARELRRQHGHRIHLMSNRPELFAGNPDIASVVPVDARFLAFAKRCGARVINPRYSRPDPNNTDRDLAGPTNLMANMLASAGIRGEAALRPYLSLSRTERAPWAHLQNCIVLQSSAAAAVRPMRTKEYGAERFQQVADGLTTHGALVQVGSRRDPLIQGALDLRGQTTLRETAAILAGASMFLGLEGGLMHLARAVDCPAVIVQGGRTTREQWGYPCNIHLVRRPACSPCGRYQTCPYGFHCLTDIPPEEVLEACVTLITKDRAGELAVDRVHITDELAATWAAALDSAA